MYVESKLTGRCKMFWMKKSRPSKAWLALMSMLSVLCQVESIQLLLPLLFTRQSEIGFIVFLLTMVY